MSHLTRIGQRLKPRPTLDLLEHFSRLAGVHSHEWIGGCIESEEVDAVVRAEMKEHADAITAIMTKATTWLIISQNPAEAAVAGTDFVMPINFPKNATELTERIRISDHVLGEFLTKMPELSVETKSYLREFFPSVLTGACEQAEQELGFTQGISGWVDGPKPSGSRHK